MKKLGVIFNLLIVSINILNAEVPEQEDYNAFVKCNAWMTDKDDNNSHNNIDIIDSLIVFSCCDKNAIVASNKIFHTIFNELNLNKEQLVQFKHDITFIKQILDQIKSEKLPEKMLYEKHTWQKALHKKLTNAYAKEIEQGMCEIGLGYMVIRNLEFECDSAKCNAIVSSMGGWSGYYSLPAHMRYKELLDRGSQIGEHFWVQALWRSHLELTEIFNKKGDENLLYILVSMMT